MPEPDKTRFLKGLLKCIRDAHFMADDNKIGHIKTKTFKVMNQNHKYKNRAEQEIY